MIPVTQLRRGVTFEAEGQLWKVLEYDHYKPGRGTAYIRTKLRNIRTGGTLARTFLSGEKVQDVRLDRQTVQYLYTDGDFFHFMNTETYEQPAIGRALLEDVIPYLKEGLTIDIELYDGEPVGIELPITVELKVVDAPPGYAGDTATNAQKEVTLESGMKLSVPLFVATGDVVRVDTRTGEYLTRL